MEKKETAIVFGATNNFAFAIASVLMDLKKFDYSWITDIVIFHDGISEKEQKLLNSILPCVFEKYNFPIKDKTKFDQSVLNYFSEMVFSKFECLRLLKYYKNVIWLDYDIVITKNISELANYCESGFKILLGHSNVLSQLNKPINDYDMNKKGICTSTFSLQDHINNYEGMYYFCYKKTEQYAKYFHFPEQAIFDFMIQEFCLKPEVIDWNVYCVHPDEKDKYDQAKILHAYGYRKFWNEIRNENWNSNYKAWLEWGGGSYNLKKYLIKKYIRILLEKIGIYQFFKKILLNFKKYIVFVFNKQV